MRKSFALLAGVAIALGAGTASAQRASGPYIGAGAGISWLYETNAAIFPPASAGLATPSDSFTAEWDPGFIGLLTAGYAFSNGFRVEAEGSYRQYEASGERVFSRSAIGFGGTARAYGVMLNGYYDLDLRRFGGPEWVVPYVGAGIGYSWTEWNDVGGRFGGAAVQIDDTDGTLAWQAMAGLSFPIAGVPGLSLSAEYRYIGTPDPTLSGRVTDAASAAQPVRIDVATHTHNLIFGVRYNFGQTRPAPAPAPIAAAPAPARTYLVFFDWDRADLTDRARQIIGEAASASRTVQTTRLEVAGHADRSGSAQYNQRLSQRRADNVAAELVRQGVPREAIVVTAFGESRPLVPTADGVREPQNRRVEIVLN